MQRLPIDKKCLHEGTSLNSAKSISLKPLKTSLILAIAYILICSLYIWISGYIAVKIAPSISELQSIELFKGLAFVLITGIIFFIFTYTLFLKLLNLNEELDIQRKALIESQARALTGSFAAGIAHDINNVLGIINFSISELQNVVPENKKKNIESINTAYNSIRDMASRLLKIGKTTTFPEKKEINMTQFLQKTIEFAKKHSKLRFCTITLKDEDALSLQINPFLFEQMLLNLMLNAAEITQSKGQIEIHIKKSTNRIFIEVHDNGPGITEEESKKLFRLYQTSKAEGTGLGLMTVKACAEIHGGTIEIGKSHLGGALFRINLPAPL